MEHLKGKFIVLDGPDGSGKATQTKLLADYLESKGISVLAIDFPGYQRNTFGALVGECLAGKRGDFLNLDPRLASLPYSCDRYESSQMIRGALAEGKVVIADRFTSSNQIHQGGKISDEATRSEFLIWLDRIEHGILGIPRPDLVVYLRVPLEVSLGLLAEKRRKSKSQFLGENELDMVEKDRLYLERSGATALWLAGREANWKLINCMRGTALGTPDEIHADVVRTLLET